VKNLSRQIRGENGICNGLNNGREKSRESKNKEINAKPQVNVYSVLGNVCGAGKS
jgi:hypothetical protein